MPDAAGIAKFDYHPRAGESEAVPKGGEAGKVSEDAEAILTAQDPFVDS
jgi:hypothetical protein